MEEGTIARLTDRGFGFISPASGGNDIFFHATELQEISFDELKEGDKVNFEIGEGPKGPQAQKVVKAAE